MLRYSALWPLWLFAIVSAISGVPSVDFADPGVSIRLADSPSLWICLQDGRDLPAPFPVKTAVGRIEGTDGRTPLSLAAGDFDGDLAIDLTIGFACDDGKGGVIALQPGDAAALSALPARRGILSGPPAASPFRAATTWVALEFRPDFLATGDFDNDGHRDLVATERGRAEAFVFPGDGQGGFGAPRVVALAGGVTALTVGEINRIDGLADLAIAIVDDEERAEILVFESPQGILRATPERFALPAPATILELGHFDTDHLADCAAAAGTELVVIRGRDRKLTLPAADRDRVAPAAIRRGTFDQRILGIARGEFLGEPGREIAALLADGRIEFLRAPDGATSTPLKSLNENRLAVLPGASRRLGTLSPPASGNRLIRARVSAAMNDDLVVLDGAGRGIGLVINPAGSEPSAPPLAFTTDDDPAEFERLRQRAALSAPPAFQTLAFSSEENVVAALPLRLNGDALDDLLVLKRSDASPAAAILTAVAGVYTVTDPGNASDSDLSDGLYAPPTLLSALQNANLEATPDLIQFTLPFETWIMPDAVLPSARYPVTLDGFLGVDDDGISRIVGIDGSLLEDQPGALDAGLSARYDSTIRDIGVFDFPGPGVALLSNTTGNNTVSGCQLGFNMGAGVNVNSPGNTIGGLTNTPGLPPGNWSGGNYGGSGQGIAIVGANENDVAGNLIGTNFDGDGPTSNSVGVYVDGTNNRIGGAAEGARNVISGNRNYGVSIGDYTGPGTLVQGNFIGCSRDGDAPLDMQYYGVLIGGGDVTIGGTAAGAGNVVGGNGGSGLSMVNAPSNSPIRGVLIQGNHVGLHPATGAPLPNLYSGIQVGELDNTVGGAVPEAANVVGCNRSVGIYAAGESGNPPGPPIRILGNIVGADKSGLLDKGNEGCGVYLAGTNTIVGGDDPATEGNLIARNKRDGIQLYGTSATGNSVKGNTIGTNRSGAVAQPNEWNGVQFLYGAHHNTISNNVISGNTENGVKLRRDPNDAQQRNASDNRLIDNRIGVDWTGAVATGNGGCGVLVDNCTTTTVEGCVVSGNFDSGVGIVGGNAMVNVVRGCVIGLNEAGDEALPNHADGIRLEDGAHHNIIGGDQPGEGNVISGNTSDGVALRSGVSDTRLGGNIIGLDSDARFAIGNGGDGVVIERSARNRVGHELARLNHTRNYIGGNAKSGVVIRGDMGAAADNENRIIANAIGENIDGEPVGNGEHGVRILYGDRNCVGPYNTIAHNTLNGVTLADSEPIIFAAGQPSGPLAVENRITRNDIHDNGLLGIDLGDDGATPNDAGDTDDGVNSLLNFPTLTAVTTGTLVGSPPTTDTAMLLIAGSLDGLPDTEFTLEFFLNRERDASLHGEGEMYLASTTVTTGPTGHAGFSASYPFGWAPWARYVSATAYCRPGGIIVGRIRTVAADPEFGDTSEFSRCVPIAAAPPPSESGWIAW